jgi:UDPglucose--hexose-1-phosphate uridylyltransferase
MDLQKLQRVSHRRYNPLTRDWVLVSPGRTERPWQGHTETTESQSLPAYDPNCYLCPGNARAGGIQNPHYSASFVFDNDFAALKPDAENITLESGGLMVAAAEAGVCRVVSFSPRHDLTLATMTTSDLRGVVDVWVEQYENLGSYSSINYVQIFENRGAIMGCSNPHPHGQIWASQNIPNEPRKELQSLEDYWLKHHSCLLCDYRKLEEALGERIVCQNDCFLALVPFWAIWPFEILLVSKRHLGAITELDVSESAALADILKRLTTRYDNLFQTPFPYSMGFHQSPTDQREHKQSHLHAHFLPPLLRSATVKKFMVGYELLASPQRDITPESAAARLREMPDLHYSSLPVKQGPPRAESQE